MKTKGHNKDYNFGSKSHWRRTVWNEVLRRTSGKEKTQPILYLAGPQDLDRVVAVSKGVPQHNLIAIDRDKSNVNRVRGQKGLSIDSDALDLLWSWPEDKAVAAVLLDFCGGFSSNNMAILDVFERKPFRQSVIMFNFLRGRDPWGNPVRDMLSVVGLKHDLLAVELVGTESGVEEETGNTKLLAEANHRGYQYLLYHSLHYISLLQGFISEEDQQIDERGWKLRFPEDEEIGPVFRCLVTSCVQSFEPKFYQYKSGPLTFDSVVCQHPSRYLEVVKQSSWFGSLCAAFRLNPAKDESFITQKFSLFKVPQIARKISATLAIRTMRLLGSLK